MREINETKVLAILRDAPMSSRTDLAERIGLSLPAVSGIVAALISRGLIEERELGASTGGRPPRQLALRASAGHVIGVKLTERAAVGVVTDLNGEVVAADNCFVNGASADQAIYAISTLVGQLRRQVGETVLYGIGVGLAGLVDRQSGIVRHGTYSNWVHVDLAAGIEKATGLPTVIDNDVNALAASEQWYGAGRGRSHFMVISFGRGIGLGMVLDGRLYRGSLGGAGEFGHLKVAAGPACACGGHGCLEALVSQGSIAQEVATVVGRPLDFDEACDVARSGHRRSTEVFERAAVQLGTATANLVNLLNPQLVILAGEGMRAKDLLWPSFHRALDEGVFGGLQDDLDVIADSWDDHAWARGAASLVLNELFQPNLHDSEIHRPRLGAVHAAPVASR